MGAFVSKDAYLSLGGTDLSAHVASLTLSQEADVPEDTAMGDDSRSYVAGGLKSWSLDVTFNQDFAAGAVDATLAGNEGTSLAMIVKPTSAAVSATNPSYTGNVIFATYGGFVGGSVGDIAQTSVSFTGTGDLTRNTS
jgi:hypothetical protein